MRGSRPSASPRQRDDLAIEQGESPRTTNAHRVGRWASWDRPWLGLRHHRRRRSYRVGVSATAGCVLVTRGSYLALDRAEVAKVAAEVGGDDIGPLLLLAAAAERDTGKVRGNLEVLAEIIRCSRKTAAVRLKRLHDGTHIHWERARGPGAEGWVHVLVLHRLDARPMSDSRKRTDPKMGRVDVVDADETHPEMGSVDDRVGAEPIRNRSATDPPPIPNRDRLDSSEQDVRPLRHKTQDTRPSSEDETQQEGVRSVALIVARVKSSKRDDLRSREGFERTDSERTVRDHGPRIRELLAKDRDVVKAAIALTDYPAAHDAAADLGLCEPRQFGADGHDDRGYDAKGWYLDRHTNARLPPETMRSRRAAVSAVPRNDVDF